MGSTLKRLPIFFCWKLEEGFEFMGKRGYTKENVNQKYFNNPCYAKSKLKI